MYNSTMPLYCWTATVLCLCDALMLFVLSYGGSGEDFDDGVNVVVPAGALSTCIRVHVGLA
jgi:hypothetical protein